MWMHARGTHSGHHYRGPHPRDDWWGVEQAHGAIKMKLLGGRLIVQRWPSNSWERGGRIEREGVCIYVCE